jgi:pimeloyl-ACP methyl ester carboxylesterase
MQRIKTKTLDVAYVSCGAPDAPAVILLHGWPDAPRAWDRIVPQLVDAGFRTIAPYLRGIGETHFLQADQVRDGRSVALVQDTIDLADALGIEQFAVVGHDWGGRTAYQLGALFPDRITAIVVLSIPYQPRGIFKIPAFPQARRIWYQWFMCTEGGAQAIRDDPKGFARIQWDTWSPGGWFDEEEFSQTATHFESADWAAITLHAYRSRYLPEACDSLYNGLQQRLSTIDVVPVPTLVIHGDSDQCDPVERFEGQEKFFPSGYRRLVLDGVGHFPAREAAERVAPAIVSLLREQQ